MDASGLAVAFNRWHHGRAAARRRVLGCVPTWCCDVRQRRIRTDRGIFASLAVLRSAAFSSELRRNFSVASFGIGVLYPQSEFISSPLTWGYKRGYNG